MVLIDKVTKRGTGPLWLMEGTSDEGVKFAARFDFHKRWFIDPVPFEQSEDENLALVREYTDEGREEI